ncbi:hypothetical protein LTR91_011794 [Friedmanniomyces endolithicus]|uniref:Uncharacterized protein n=1 Tax=Friedmanniomyces endolithicus TaxID=329885 RepID=A0AAN6KGV7_9PEZI|nr:hypothetical protein LTR91_011794 [Friedmanniomyces endolithicus]
MMSSAEASGQLTVTDFLPQATGRWTPPIQRLSNELLRAILDHLVPDPERTVPIDRRQFLSVESFVKPLLDSGRGAVKDVGAFRSTCRRFADVGAPLLYTRVAARFSKNGLKKLEQLTEWPHLARHVKKFSYLVPYFYKHAPDAGEALLAVHANHLRQKVEEQRQIVDSEEDVRVLKKAIASFASLQFVQLLRLTDEEDRALLTYIHHHGDSRQLLEWAPACSRGSRTIGTALLHSDVPWSRFSSPTLSPQSATFLAAYRPQSLSTLAARLTCLTLHFDDGNDLDQKMSELSDLFRTVFSTAVNMQAVHVGFPSHRPLTLRLKDVFHNVTWEKLVAFGVQGWKLDAEEIIDLALRHRERLKGLRLRDVLLKDGSAWKDVLSVLRDSMYRLEWVSLRRIGYARHFDEVWLAAGAEVPEDPPPGESDSDESAEDDEPIVGSSMGYTATNGAVESDDEQSGSEMDSDDEREPEPESNDMDFPLLTSLDTPRSAPWCNCNGASHVGSVEDLNDDGHTVGDDGYTIPNLKRKAWENNGKMFGFNEYHVDIWGEELYRVSVSLRRNGQVHIRHLDGWVKVSEYLCHLKVKIDLHYTNGTPEMRSDLQSQWWRVNGKAFPILQLPRELRDIIYDYSFGSKIEPYPTNKARLGAKAKPQRGVALMRVNRQVSSEIRSLLGRQTPFLIEHNRIMALLLSSPLRRNHIRRLELALSHKEFINLFGFTFPDVHYETRWQAKALRGMQLKHLMLRIARPSLITGSVIFDGACQQVATGWILAAAWPFVKGHPVEVAGYVKRQQKAEFEAACLDVKNRFEQWNGLRVAVGHPEGSLGEYDEWVDWVEGGEEAGGVRLIEESSQEVQRFVPDCQVGELPPRCECGTPCTAREWTEE